MMKKLLLLVILLLPLAAWSSTISGSCTVNGSSSNIAGISPFPVYFDYTGTTDTIYPKGTGTGYLATGAVTPATATTLPVGTGVNTILGNAVFTVSPSGTASTVMTISSVTSGVVSVGSASDKLTGGTLTGAATIVSFGTFNGTSGMVNLSIPQTWANNTTVTENNGDYIKVAGTGLAGITATSGQTVLPYGTWPTLSTVVITDTVGDFTAAATTLYVGMPLQISGTFGGTGSISGYSNPTTYFVIATNGTTTFQLSATKGGGAITTTAGTPTGLTYTYTYYAAGMHMSGVNIAPGASIASIQPNVSFTMNQSAISSGTNTVVIDDPNEYQVISTVGAPVTSITIASPGLTYPIVGAETVTVQPNYRWFHLLDYKTNYGDPTGSPVLGPSWNTDIAGSSVGTGFNISRNLGRGPLGFHFYEIASGGGDKVFSPTVYITDANGVVGTTVSCPTVTVYDPEGATNGYGAANKTACIANGVTPVAGDADGCPAVATCGTSNICQNASNYPVAIAAAITAGARRILVRRGDSFTSSAQLSMSVSGIQIGSYGPTSNPLPIVTASGGVGVAVYRPQPALSGLIVRDTALVASNAGNYVLNNAGNGTTNVALLRVTVSGFRDGIDGGPFPQNGTSFDHIAMQDSDLINFDSTGGGGAYATYCAGCNHLALLGNYTNPCSQINAEGVRLQSGNYSVMEHNTHVGSQSPACGTFTIRGDTQYGVESDNVALNFGPTFRPESGSYNEDVRDWIAERNYTTWPYRVESHSTTLRNNATITNTGISIVDFYYISATGSPMVDNVFVYNYSGFNSVSGASNHGITLEATAPGFSSGCHIYAQNNLVYMPNATSPTMFIVNGGSCNLLGASGTYGNSSDAQVAGTNPFSVGTPAVSLDLRILNGSYGTNNNNTNSSLLFPSSYNDMLGGLDNTNSRANIRAGAFVPATNSINTSVP